ncbi:hypothetical protein ACJ72_08583, partial [Emergomyces africanus]
RRPEHHLRTVLSLLTSTVSYSYIIDAEDAYEINYDEEPHQVHACALIAASWGIAGPEVNTCMGLDPMVLLYIPHEGKCIEDPDEKIFT